MLDLEISISVTKPPRKSIAEQTMKAHNHISVDVVHDSETW